MARKKISAMTAASAYTGSNEFYELVQGGNTRQGSHALLKTYFDTLYAPVVGYAKISDTKAANTNGGGLTSGSFVTRTINTEDTDPDGIVSIASNQFTLQAGTYRIAARVPGYAVGRHKARLRNITDGADALLGTSQYGVSTVQAQQTDSVIVGQITIASAKTFEIQHRVETTNATNGGGVESNFGVSEVYTVVELWKVA